MRWKFTCWSCKTETEMHTQVFRSHRCRHCDADMLACRNCRFYDPQASKQCREPVSEPVHDKEKANFCDYFRPADHSDGGPEVSEAEAARARLNDLFKF